jgi:hypothetical protein
MIFIARNYKSKIVGIISANSEGAVRAYYQGKGLDYDTLTEFKIEEDRENEKMGYVTPILETEEVYPNNINRDYKEKLLLVK